MVTELNTRLDLRLREGGIQVVVAPSGAGKSSLLRAGLLPGLDRGSLPGSRKWPKLLFTPTSDPLAAFAEAIARWTGDDPAAAAAELADGRLTILSDALRRPDGDPDARVVVVVDQFEELFTLCSDDQQRHAFIDLLAEIADPAKGPRGLVVVGVRADFYAACVNQPAIRTALQDSPLVVGPMSQPELREVILFPAQAVGLDVEPGLVEVLLRDLGVATEGYEVGRLPLLAHALRGSWQQRHGATLTVQGYRDTGGIEHAIATTAERTYTALDDDGQRVARWIFRRLVKIGDGTEDVRRRGRLAELLDAAGSDHATAAAVVDAFTGARLLTRQQDSVEITHEALLHSWPRLKTWISTDRVGRLTHQDLEESAAAWDRADRDSSLLFRGSRLTTTQAWVDSALPGELSPLGDAFLMACLRARTRDARLRTGLIAVLTALVVVASTAAVLFFQEQREAVRQRDLAVYNRVLAEADQLRGSDVSLSAQLHLVAHRIRPGDETASRLITAANGPLSTPLTGHTDRVTAVRFSPDGRTLVTGGMDETGSTRVWDVANPTRPEALGRSDGELSTAAHSLAYSPDGRTVATGGLIGLVRLWTVADPTRPAVLRERLAEPNGWPGQAGIIVALAFSPDGRFLAAASESGTAQLWNVADPALAQSPSEVLGHGDSVRAVVFSPDGRLLATGGDDATIRLWDVTDYARPALVGTTLRGHAGTVNSLAFSPDGSTLASAGADSTIRLWDVTDTTAVTTLGATPRSHLSTMASSVAAVAFSPDGRTLAGGNSDSTVQLWNIADPARPKHLGSPLRGHVGTVGSVAFSPDGRTLATGSLDQTVRLWNLPGTVLTGASATPYSVAFSPDGRTLATGTGEPGVRLWDLSDPTRPAPLGSPLTDVGEAVVSVVFSPDGRTLATGGGDAAVRLWDVSDPARPTPVGEPLAGHEHSVNSVAFSPDGRTLATGSSDSATLLWDISTPGRPAPTSYPLANDADATRLSGRSDAIFSVAFSPDGRTVATGSSNYTVRVWDVADRARPVPMGPPLTGHTQTVMSVAFSPDGRTVATGGADATVRLWSLADPTRPAPLGSPLTGHSQTVLAVAFSPDGRTLATSSADATVRLWDLTDPTRPAPRGSPLTGHTDAVRALAFGPDGHTLATGGSDLSVRLTELDVERGVERICAVTGNTLTAGAWDRYVGGDLPYDPPCG
ncbi:WD40 repeat protein [Saccharothrix longispora]|uniref:WD40 repeat protein n=1 Tax=Saccharothrix longispora TaxID=33920 RepID=A0ABU1Q686_9PSEU|nr:hypothetical protein [Saccharothrix longispora]MDR6598384.1 WD40 repeat protein [Saccharothrix longispora]